MLFFLIEIIVGGADHLWVPYTGRVEGHFVTSAELPRAVDVRFNPRKSELVVAAAAASGAAGYTGGGLGAGGGGGGRGSLTAVNYVTRQVVQRFPLEPARRLTNCRTCDFKIV